MQEPGSGPGDGALGAAVQARPARGGSAEHAGSSPPRSRRGFTALLSASGGPNSRQSCQGGRTPRPPALGGGQRGPAHRTLASGGTLRRRRVSGGANSASDRGPTSVPAATAAHGGERGGEGAQVAGPGPPAARVTLVLPPPSFPRP